MRAARVHFHLTIEYWETVAQGLFGRVVVGLVVDWSSFDYKTIRQQDDPTTELTRLEVPRRDAGLSKKKLTAES